jgi:UDP-3-O-[3-hydroxymyristoyl] glucosamine N-acyltransferase
VQELARLTGAEIQGRGELVIKGLRALDDAGPEFVSPLLRKKMLARAPSIPGAVLTRPQLARFALESDIRAVLLHRDPLEALICLIDLFHPLSEQPCGVHPAAHVSSQARVHPSAWIGPGAVVEQDVVIGVGSWIGPGAIICQGSEIGAWVRIGPGAVIGSEGFGYLPRPQGPKKVRQIGVVRIGDHVEIGANTCIDRATLGATVIGRLTKIDNLVQIGHNVRLGEGVLIAGQTGVAGSTVIGDGAMLGGQVGIADHVAVGSRAKVAAGSGVARDVSTGAEVAGYPARTRGDWLREVARASRAGRRGRKKDAEE